MRRLISLATVAMAMVIATAVLSSASASGRDHDDNGETLRLEAETVDSADIDVGDTGLSLGDYFTFTDDVSKRGRKVGEIHGSCMVTRIDGEDVTVNCVATLTLKRGQITLQGVLPADEEEKFTVAVTGGTDRYSDAAGELTVRPVSDTRSRLKLELED